jgi:hypothetical protein
LDGGWGEFCAFFSVGEFGFVACMGRAATGPPADMAGFFDDWKEREPALKNGVRTIIVANAGHNSIFLYFHQKLYYNAYEKRHRSPSIMANLSKGRDAKLRV